MNAEQALWPLAAGLAGGAGLMAYAVRAPSSAWLAPSVHRGVSSRRSIALTFDDGPSESTPAILETLDRWRARATFFLIGSNVSRLPSIAREIVRAGHEIGNHSHSHPSFQFRTFGLILEELSRAQQAILEHTGTTARYFRAPFGVRWFGLREAQNRLGLLGVMWTAIGLDWKYPEDRIVRRLIRKAGPGAIFCLHDGRALSIRPDIRETAGALRRLVPALQDQGFHFETMSEILCPTT